MRINKLKPSILELPIGEAMNLITSIRRDRREFKVKKKKSKQIVAIDLSPSAMTPEQAALLLSKLGVEDDTENNPVG